MGSPVVHFEVIGADGPALEKFYADLFGWHVQSMPEMSYGLVDTHGGGGVNGGIGTAQEGASYVTFYVEVPDLQATLDRVASLGGTTVSPPFEMAGVVAFAQFSDPAGNRIGLVRSAGPEDGGQMGPSAGDGAEVSWFEVLGADALTLERFYHDVFGWTSEKSDLPGGHVYFEVEASGVGIPGGIGSSADGRPHATVYARVDDPQKVLERAESLGGTTVMAPRPAGESTVIAQFADPQGNVFGVYKAG